MLNRLSEKLDGFLHQPGRVFFYGALVTLFILTVDGSLWRFWSLQKSHGDMEKRIVSLEKKAKKLDFEIHQAKKLSHIERQATEQFNYVRKGDLIFIFSE